MSKRTASFVVTSFFFAIAVLGFAQRQWIKDTIIVNSTELEQSSQAVLGQIALTDRAEFIYRASQPKVQSAEQFNQSCRGVSKEYSIVLGCYTQQKLFVFDVQDNRLDGVIQVTAAHELLHGVYERLSQSEKMEIDAKLLAFADTVQDKRFNETVAQYKKAEPEHIANELHSMIGTELEKLPPDLEAYYEKYFFDRAKIVTYAHQYEDSLEQYSSQITAYDTQLKVLEREKNELERTLDQKQKTIESEAERINSLRSSGETQTYNSQVPGYNNRIQAFNGDIKRMKQIISEYNLMVEKRNALATTQNDLVQKLDSRYQSIQH